jgi:hypothetical protein
MQRQRNYWTRREETLATLIGRDAAWLINTCTAWALAVFACVVLPKPLALVVYPDSSSAGLALIGGLFLLGVACMTCMVVLNARGAKLAEAYVAKEVGHPVRIASAQLSVGWWRKRIERERR